MLLFLVLLCLAPKSYIAQASDSFDTACWTDGDCRLLNGICSSYRGNGGLSVCMCDVGMVWDDAAHWCDTGYPAVRDIQYYRLSGTVYLAEQARVALYDSLRGLALLPTEWFCRGRYCWTVYNGVHYAHYQASVIAGNATNTGNVYLYAYDLVWRCVSSDLFPVRITDDMTPTPQDGSGVRLFNEYCLTCAQFCGPNGVCNNSTCVCNDGWTGKRCRTPNQAQSQVAPLSTGWPYALHYNCTTDAECERVYFRGNNSRNAVGCYVVADGEKGVVAEPLLTACWCLPGHVPYAYLNVSSSSFSNSTSSMALACVRAATQTLYGAVFAQSTTRASLVSIVLPERRFLYVQTELAVGAVYSPARGAYNDDSYRINASALNLWRCQNQSFFFFYKDGQDAALASSRISLSYASFDVHCLGVAVACSGGQNAAGKCSCPTRRVGRYCDRCLEGWAGPACATNATVCRRANCSNHGECTTGACACDRGYFGTNCSVNSFACRQQRCSGNGECFAASSCSCDYGYFGNNCSQSTAQCALQRCSGHGTCFYHSYGCACDRGFTSFANCSRPSCAHGSAIADVCVCEPGWSGVLCDVATCGAVNATFVDGACRCALAFHQTWPDCSRPRCPPGASPNPVDGKESCVCDPGYAASVSGGCAKLCWPNGTAATDGEVCTCRADYTGDFCETLIVQRRIPEALRRVVPDAVVTQINVTALRVLQPAFLDTSFFGAALLSLWTILPTLVIGFLFFVFAHLSHTAAMRHNKRVTGRATRTKGSTGWPGTR